MIHTRSSTKRRGSSRPSSESTASSGRTRSSSSARKRWLAVSPPSITCHGRAPDSTSRRRTSSSPMPRLRGEAQRPARRRSRTPASGSDPAQSRRWAPSCGAGARRSRQRRRTLGRPQLLSAALSARDPSAGGADGPPRGQPISATDAVRLVGGGAVFIWGLRPQTPSAGGSLALARRPAPPFETDHQRQLLVLDAVRLVGGGAELLAAPLLVLGEVALEPADLAVALERQDVRGDAVEEPAVVADDRRRSPGSSRGPSPGRAACRRRGRSSARRAAGRCRRSSAAWPGGRGCARRRRDHRPASAGPIP